MVQKTLQIALQWMILLWSPGTLLAQAQSIGQITHNDYWDADPMINNGQITWRGFDGNDSEVF